MDELNRLDKLTPELIGKIFAVCSDIDTHEALTSFSLRLKSIFKPLEDFFVKEFLKHHIGPIVLPEALFYHRVLEVINKERLNILAVFEVSVEQLESKRSLSGELWDVKSARALASIHHHAKALAVYLWKALLEPRTDLYSTDLEKPASPKSVERRAHCFFSSPGTCLIGGPVNLALRLRQRMTSPQERPNIFDLVQARTL